MSIDIILQFTAKANFSNKKVNYVTEKKTESML